MKYLFVMGLMLSQFAQAEMIKCISEDKKFEIIADVDFAAKKVVSMDYYKNGAQYLSFTNLDMSHSRSFFTAWRDNYNVIFQESALYMELYVSYGEIYGNFLPKNSVVALERHISCSRE